MKLTKTFWQQVNWVQAHEISVIFFVLLGADANSLSLLIGCICSLIGWFLRLAVQGLPKSTDQFLIVGPYRWVRHPYYLGTYLLFLGLGIASRSWLALAVILMGIIPIFLKKFHEEERLVGRMEHPDFREYRSCVPSFLPSILPYPAEQSQGGVYSLRQAFVKKQRRELDTILAIGVGYGALYGLSVAGSFVWLKWLLAIIIFCVLVIQMKIKTRMASI